MADDLAAKLRAADEETIYRAMDQARIDLPINDRAELLKALNRVLDVLGVSDADGDLCDDGDDGDVGNYEDR